MNLESNEEQTAFVDALQKLLGPHAFGDRAADGARSFFSADVDAALEEGFLDAMRMDSFGPIIPALLVQEVAARPIIVEVGASAFIRPALCPERPRPLAIVAGRPDRPARFLREARSVLFLGESELRIFEPREGDVEAVDPFFAYPMGRLTNTADCLDRSQTLADAATARRLLLVATSCEISGALQGALDSVIEHVKNRRQFGRPLGSFQAVQHRLAGCATSIAAGRWLARKAAALGGMDDALIAAGYLQDCAARILYDLHQFMGAMGLTLEHPLYRWSYRVKLLASELGGASRHLRDAATLTWN